MKTIKYKIREIFLILSFYNRVKSEQRRVMRLVKSKKTKNITIVCDLRRQPPTYGDFIYVLILASILQKRFIVTFVIINRRLRGDWKYLSDEAQKILIEDFVKLAKQVIKDPIDNVIVDTSVEFGKESVLLNPIFASRVLKSKGIYVESICLSLILYRKLGCTSENLLEKSHFAPKPGGLRGPYICWHVRRGNRTNLGGSVTDDEFVNQYKGLRKVFGESVSILVISSDLGLSQLLKLASERQMSILSSREFSDGFVGDLNLVINSDLYIQFNGGGMFVGAMGSNVPYFITRAVPGPTQASQSWVVGTNNRKGRLASWQSEFQIFQTGSTKNWPKIEIDWTQLEDLANKLHFSARRLT